MYIPKGKLDPNIYYTNGGEYILSTTRTEYKGYYHKDLLGGIWTDKEHSVDSIKLISNVLAPPIPLNINTNDASSAAYYSVSQKSNKPTPQQVEIPPNDSEPPTSTEYQQTYYTRYILEYKLSSKPIYIEVNKNTYYGIRNSNESRYFNMVEVLWKIYGPLYDVKQNGVLVKGGIVDSNLRSIQEANKTMPGIINYLNNLVLYAEIVG
jgi:hypothetical protein